MIWFQRPSFLTQPCNFICHTGYSRLTTYIHLNPVLLSYNITLFSIESVQYESLKSSLTLIGTGLFADEDSVLLRLDKLELQLVHVDPSLRNSHAVLVSGQAHPSWGC